MPFPTPQLTACLLWAATVSLLQGQEAVPAPAAPEQPAAPAEEKVPTAANADQLMRMMAEKDAKARQRIREIEGIVFPVEDALAVELFFFAPGEYTFLRLQSEIQRTAGRFFDAQSRIDQDSFDGVAEFFDLAYDQMKTGKLWVGREQNLITEDAALFNELRAKVQEAIRKRPDGQKLLDLLAERDRLIQERAQSGPVLKYFTERRMWWRSYPEYQEAVKNPPER